MKQQAQLNPEPILKETEKKYYSVAIKEMNYLYC